MSVPKVSACVIGYSESAEELCDLVAELQGQSLPPFETIITDNSPDARLIADESLNKIARVVRSADGNVGYSSGINIAAREASGDFLFFLNSDASADPDCVSILVETLQDDPQAAIAGAQILLPDGAVNAGDNPVHVSGISWSGRYGESVEREGARQVFSISGAACMVRASSWTELDGFSEGLFMYHDDVDLSWRAHLRGMRVIYQPRALVTHVFEFNKGVYKWEWMERNRWWCLLSNYSALSLLALSPVLLVTELAVVALSVREGWWREKMRSYRRLLASRDELRAHRRKVQSNRAVRDAELIKMMSWEIETPLLQTPKALNRFYSAGYKLARLMS